MIWQCIQILSRLGFGSARKLPLSLICTHGFKEIPMGIKLERYIGNPILSPNPESEWESLVTTNPAVWYEQQTGEFWMLYRAAGNDIEHRIFFGLAKSRDGYRFERVSDQPVFGPSADGFDMAGVEDPRLVKFGEHYFLTYACRPIYMRQYWKNENNRSYRPENPPEYFPRKLRFNLTSTGLAISTDLKTWTRAGLLTDPRCDDRDVILFPEKVKGKFVTLHRPIEWCGQGFENSEPAMWIAFSDDLLEPKSLKLLAQAKYDWEGLKIGGSAPPLKTDDGWLTLYHSVGSDKYYRIGAMLLDLDNPSIVTHRTRDWIFQPEKEWETKGYYNGVVFPCGNVVVDGTLFVYYGGGDIHCGVATCKLDDLMDYLISCPGE